jgi:alkylation response protein AidB-like acyl-CoA dehydrogenase
VQDVQARVDALAPTIRDGAAAAEQQGHLTQPVVDGLHAAGLFGALVPAELGGLDLTLPESVELYRAVSEHDASTGWTLAILANGALFARLVGDATADLVVDGTTLIAGSLNPLSATAEPVDGGYRLTGTANYASGCHHADWLMVAAWVERDGERSFVDGIPELIAGVVPIGAATILDTWSTTGMRGTGSDDCRVDGVVVDERLTFPWGDAAWSDDDVWSRIPLLVQIGPALVSTLVGAARGALEDFVELAGGKVPAGSFDLLADKAGAQRAVGEAEGLLLAAEATLRAATADVWEQGLAGRPFELADRARMRTRVVTAGQLAARCVDLLHGAAGMTSITRGTRLERAWRDVHTGTQHIMINPTRYEVTGRVRLGRDPGTPIV